MNEKALKTLEYDKVLQLLAQGTASDMGRDAALRLKPAQNLPAAIALMERTDEAYSYYRRNGKTPIMAFPDIRETLKKSKAAYALSPGDLLRIALCLKASRTAREEIEGEENAPQLTLLANRLSAHRSIEEEINRCILSEEEINDNASPELARIRRQMRITNERVREKLNGMIKSPTIQRYLQDPIITMRNGRFALPVKAEYRAQVGGLVHDQSGSGATLFVEPAAVVELGNEFRRLEAEEKKEIDRILAGLTALAAPYADELAGSLELLALLDLTFAKAILAREQRGQRPELTDNGFVMIKQGRHPLLDPDKVVPIDVWLGEDWQTLIVTGPNTGGKTVTLKTVGLFTLMAMSGMFVPAELGTSLSVFTEVFADIGDEQSIEQSLSTFSSHMKNLVDILNRADESSLVLLDELGAGTDPVEGAALAQAILERLLERGATTLATTHYSEIKAFAMTRTGMQNASMEFDVDRLCPTYRLLVGIPGKSNAFEIAKRLGLDDAMILRAGDFLQKSDVAFEDVLSSADRARREAEQEKDAAREARYEAERIRGELAQQKKKLEEEKAKIREKAREDARRTVLETRAEMEQLIKDLRSIPNMDPKTLERTIQQARDAARKSEERLTQRLTLSTTDSSKPPEHVQPGQRVKILSLDQEGNVLKKENDRGEVAVQVGVIKMMAHIGDLRILDAPKQQQKTGSRVVLSAPREGSRTELDLRGKMVDEAVMEIDRFIDESSILGISEFAVIHGKGTGALRTGVQNFLKHHSRVKSYRMGAYGEGDAGVTVVTLK
ncbi:MAG: endonuclease MutS2 [Clostridia bacterium]|nr:endonuclease MutS2 [Clostridia bacterium]